MERDRDLVSLRVKTIDGHLFEVRINLEDSVASLKEILAEVGKVLARKVKYQWRGKD
jgi:hypothetical protein